MSKFFKSIIISILAILYVFLTFPYPNVTAMNTTTASTQFNPKYQVNAPKMTDSELREYYRENDIFISSNETGSVTNVLKNSSDVMAHL